MASFFLVLLIAVAACCLILRWRRPGLAICAVLALYGLAVGCGPAARALADGLQSDFEQKPDVHWGARNVIVVLGAGLQQVADRAEPGPFAYARIAEAARLYAACRQASGECKVLLSGGDPAGLGVSEAEIYGQLLVRLGVDSAQLVLEPRSRNTWQNAQFSSPMLNADAGDRIVLVTSSMHMRRSLLYFGHFGVSATPARADYFGVLSSAMPVAYNFAVADLALHEYLGIARYHVYNLMGWNPPRVS